MNRDDKRIIKIGLAISAFAVILYFGLQNFDQLKAAFGFTVSLLEPFIYGVCFAFVLNVLMRLVEGKLLSLLDKRKIPKWKKVKRPLGVLITVILFLGIIAALISVILPQLVKSSIELGNEIPNRLTEMEKFANGLLGQLGISTDINTTVTNFFAEFSDKLLTYITSAVPKILEATKTITSGVFNVIMGFVIGIYMLSTKEKLLRNLKRVVYAYLPKRGADYTAHVYVLANKRFTGFVSGQLTEAVILGVLCFLGMSFFKMEYALLISAIIGITNVIPIIGPIIGAVPGALIMLMIDPMKAVWFVIFIIVLQQIESNLIYPKVVGDSIGLPGLWVIFAILVGGGLFGFAGVILGVPAFAVGYTLVAENVQGRLKKREISL